MGFLKRKTTTKQPLVFFCFSFLKNHLKCFSLKGEKPKKGKRKVRNQKKDLVSFFLFSCLFSFLIFGDMVHKHFFGFSLSEKPKAQNIYVHISFVESVCLSWISFSTKENVYPNFFYLKCFPFSLCFIFLQIFFCKINQF